MGFNLYDPEACLYSTSNLQEVKNIFNFKSRCYRFRKHGYPSCEPCCSLLFGSFLAEWNEEIKSKILSFLEYIDNEKRCDVCKRKYKLTKKKLYSQHLYLFPIAHVNIYASICPSCLMKTIYNDSDDDENRQLK